MRTETHTKKHLPYCRNICDNLIIIFFKLFLRENRLFIKVNHKSKTKQPTLKKHKQGQIVIIKRCGQFFIFNYKIMKSTKIAIIHAIYPVLKPKMKHKCIRTINNSLT